MSNPVAFNFRHDYQGIVPPRKRSYLDFDPGAKVADSLFRCIASL